MSARNSVGGVRSGARIAIPPYRCRRRRGLGSSLIHINESLVDDAERNNSRCRSSLRIGRTQL